ncbi:MAG: glycosyltransferase family 4 protein [Phycisphaerales bacterium]
MRPFQFTFPVVLLQSGLGPDPYPGVEKRLAARGIRAARILPDQPPPELADITRVLVLTEWLSPISRQLLRQARARGVAVVVIPDHPTDPRCDNDLAHLHVEFPGRLFVAHGEELGSMHAPDVPAQPAGRGSAILNLIQHAMSAAATITSPRSDPAAAKRVAPRAPGLHLRPILDAAPLLPPSTLPTVVNCVVIDDSPVGGVRVWADRLARGFADHALGFCVRTLIVATRPDLWDSCKDEVLGAGHTSACIIDPTADQPACLRCLVDSIRSTAGGKAPDFVIPNYSDLTHAAAAQWRQQGSRSVMIAHTDDDYYRFLARSYLPFDAAVGVSAACSQWLEPIVAASRSPMDTITYGVPVASAPRTVPATGPIHLAYIGRMVQVQKRISDLLLLADELESLGVPFVLHMVGDGADLPAWRVQYDRRTFALGRVEFHGRRDPEWVQQLLPCLDFAVLVSDSEGTSITMLEAMGAGVVPAVTEVSSGVQDWVIPGVTGVTAPVGQPASLARAIAALARDRARLQAVSRAAWQKVRESISVERMCRQYAALFRTALATTRPSLPPSDLGLRLHEPWRWTKRWCEFPGHAKADLHDMLSRCGLRRPAWHAPTDGCDAVIIDTDLAPPTPALSRDVAAWRASGLGVVMWPNLLNIDTGDDARARALNSAGLLLDAARAAVRDGCTRIAIYGIGKHTRRVPAVFAQPLPFVGFLDDADPPWEYMFGLPVCRAADALATLRPDAVILSSDAWEPALWDRSALFRAAGVKVFPLYASYESKPARSDAAPVAA